MEPITNVVEADDATLSSYYTAPTSHSDDDPQDESEPSLSSFFVGQKFKTFENLQLHLKNYEAKHSVQFWRRDSRTIKAAKTRLGRAFSEKIKYSEINYKCVHGGRRYETRGEGKRDKPS